MEQAAPHSLSTGIPGLDGILLGEPLSAFRGVLTGVPEYRGESDPLM